ncbi:MAG TPA: enoyl-[acyl-carrier-protein] reductase FabI, partial [Magnetospirillum sp.]|nr:enoyl-[acyl-carrier-protein] reductase FabI [Magnetospirillum sp.]
MDAYVKPYQQVTKLDLTGKKGLVVGIANDQSIAYGCAKHCRAYGA